MICILLNISFAQYNAEPSDETRFIHLVSESTIDFKNMTEVIGGDSRKIYILQKEIRAR